LQLALINNETTVMFFDVEQDEFTGKVKELWHEERQTPMITFMHDWSDKDGEKENDYYVIEFRKGQALGLLQLEELLEPDVLARLKRHNSNLYLVVANSHEAFLSCVQDVYSGLVDRYSIPAHKIILMTGAFEANKLNQEIIASRDNQDSIKIKLILDFEKGAANTLDYLISHMDFQFKPTLEKKEYATSFLNFNRRWRTHRPLFIAMLLAEDLLDNGLVSFGPSDCGRDWQETFPMLLQLSRNLNNITLTKQLMSIEDELVTLPPRYIDHQELVTNRAEFFETDDWMYSDTYFSLVSETHYLQSDDEHGIFFSEKIFKPISFKHPFILIAPCGSLSALKSIGYKTFAPYINESYDAEQDDIKRMQMIIEETKRLDSLEGDALYEWIDNVKEICEKNFNILMKKGRYDFAHKVNY